MKIIDVKQGSDEWKQIRAGNVTASRVCDVLAKIKSGEAATRRNYRAQLVAELLTGKPQENGFVSSDMQRGTELEPLARAAYEIHANDMVDQVGFVLHGTMLRYGASPDGLVGEGGLELKCPKAATHIDYLLGKVVPAEYQPQMLSNMDVCERPWWDFGSYHPEMPEGLRLFVCRLYRDDKRIAEIRDEVTKFNFEVEVVLQKLGKLGGGE